MAAVSLRADVVRFWKRFAMRLFIIGFAGILVLMFMGYARADEGISPPKSLPLSKILKKVESQKVQPVKVSVQQQKWLIDGISAEGSVRVTVSARNGGIMSTEPIADLEPVEARLSMATIIRKLEEAQPGPIYRVHFAKNQWFVETKRGKTVTEVVLSADNGELMMGRDE